MADLGREEKGLTGAGGSSGGSPLFSDAIRLIERPLSKQRRQTTTAAWRELGQERVVPLDPFGGQVSCIGGDYAQGAVYTRSTEFLFPLQYVTPTLS